MLRRMTWQYVPRVAVIAGLRTPFAKSGTHYAHLTALDLGKIVVAELVHVDRALAHRILGGDEEGFSSWQEANPEKWKSFTTWFGPNKLEVNNKNKFMRTQY